MNTNARLMASVTSGRQRRCRRWLPTFWVALLCFLSVGPAFAQAGNILIDDPDRLFGDGAAVRAAAQRLANEGADVIVVGVGDAGADAQRYIDNRLNELDVAPSTKALRGRQIVFYVAPRPGFDGLYFVSAYRDELQPVFRQIVTEQMRPRFTREDYSGGMVAGIDAVRTTLNPPPSPVPWIVGGTVATGAAGFAAAGAIRRRKAAAETLATARKRMEEARRAAGVAIADLGQRMTLAREKAQYDKLSYAPADVERITERQRRGEEQFAQAHTAFDSAEEAQQALTNPTVADYESLAAKYLDAQRLAEEAAQSIGEAEQMRAALDASGVQNTGATRRLES